jgi:hypothetical protein
VTAPVDAVEISSVHRRAGSTKYPKVLRNRKWRRPYKRQARLRRLCAEYLKMILEAWASLPGACAGSSMSSPSGSPAGDIVATGRRALDLRFAKPSGASSLKSYSTAQATQSSSSREGVRHRESD